MDVQLKDKQTKIFKDHFKDHPFPFKASYGRRKVWNDSILNCLRENQAREKNPFV